MLFSGHDSHCTHGLSGAMANCSNRHESLHRAQSTFQQAVLIDSVDCYFGFFSPQELRMEARALPLLHKSSNTYQNPRKAMKGGGGFVGYLGYHGVEWRIGGGCDQGT